MSPADSQARRDLRQHVRALIAAWRDLHYPHPDPGAEDKSYRVLAQVLVEALTDTAFASRAATGETVTLTRVEVYDAIAEAAGFCVVPDGEYLQ